MKVASRHQTLLVASLLIGFCVGLCIASFYRDLNQLKVQVEQTFKSRYELSQQFIALQRDRVQVMNNSVKTRKAG